MDVHLFNTARKMREKFVPIDAQNVRFYVCGPTVYDRAHLGNARPVLVFDMLFRLLRARFGESKVTYIRNFTDIDDRINETAKKRKAAGATGSLEELIRSRSDETIEWYHSDMDQLNALRPTAEPRATDYMSEMIAMIEELEEKGFAYAHEGHVLFRVRAYKEYGALSGRSLDDMIAGARVEIAPYKEDPLDFVLWKPSDDDLPGWNSPWGRGRPGWHIECSAMSHSLLGARFDIHGGGNDLVFPHHENEIAQSCCLGHGFASIWMHNEMLLVEGKKMSKSLGNFFTVRELLDRNIPGEVIRLVMLGTHYRKPMDWTDEKARIAKDHLISWYALVGDIAATTDDPAPFNAVAEKLADDLNTPGAISVLHQLARAAKEDGTDQARAAFRNAANLMGFLQGPQPDWAQRVDVDLSAYETHFDALRTQAKLSKDFSRVDALKADLIAAGVEVQVTPQGTNLLATEQFDPNQLPELE